MLKSYEKNSGSFSKDLDLLLATKTHKPFSPKTIVMGKARIIEKRLDGDRVYQVTFHHTITEEH